VAACKGSDQVSPAGTPIELRCHDHDRITNLKIKAAGNATDVFDIILDAYESLGESMPLLVRHHKILDQAPMTKVLGQIFQDISEFHREAMKLFKGRGKNPSSRESHISRLLITLSMADLFCVVMEGLRQQVPKDSWQSRAPQRSDGV